MNPDDTYGIWNRKGATLSDKSARKEFGLTQKEIIRGINEGKLQYRIGSIYGNPYFRLLRHEVEAFAEMAHGAECVERKQMQNELEGVNKELRQLKKRMAELEKRKTELLAGLNK